MSIICKKWGTDNDTEGDDGDKDTVNDYWQAAASKEWEAALAVA